MRKLFYFLCLFLISCAIYDSGYNQFIRKGIVVKSNAIYYQYKNGDIGDKKGLINLYAGDTVLLLGYRFKTPGISAYSILYNKDTIFINKDDVFDLDDYAIYIMPRTFTVPKDQDEIVWGRANKYVSDHADLKIQTQTNFLIETYSPTYSSTNYTQIAFKITRQPLGEKVEFEVNAFIGKKYYGTKTVDISFSIEEAKKCAYYMLYGK